MEIVHEEERDAIVAIEIARAEELPIAFEIGETEEIWTEHFQETGRAAAVLNVRPSVAIDGAHVKAVARGDKRSFVPGEGIERRRIGDDLMTSEVSLLRDLHGRRK